MKVGKNFKRIAAAAMAGILVLGSINLSGLSVSADNSGRRTPYYDDVNHKYVYDGNDILGAATHVHLFGRTVISNAHTHGNIFCQTGRLGENGTRQENNDTTDGIGIGGEFNPITWYHEVNYIQQRLECINAASSLDVLVVGNGISYGGEGTNRWVQTTGGQAALNKTNGIYQDTPAATAIDFNTEFGILENRSRDWSKIPTSSNISYDITSDMNNRYINVNGRNAKDNVYLNISYDEWRWGGNGNQIKIYGLDGTTTNKGVLIINIDMKGVENPDFSLSGAGLLVSTNNGEFNNREFKTSEYGSYRILFNLYDSGQADRIYRGNATFSNVVCGTILAPGASVTVGAVNGTVAADTIIHNGQESHRMDLWALGTEGDSDYENPYVDLTLYKEYEGITGNVDESILAATTFGLYSDAACTTQLATAYPYNNEGKVEVTFPRAVNSLQVGDNLFYIKEISAPWGYTASNTVYQCKVTVNGENKIESVQYSVDGSGFSPSLLTCVNTRATTTTETSTVTLSLIKVYQPLPANEAARATLLGSTTFGLFKELECSNRVDGVSDKNPVYVNGNQAVVSFDMNMSGSSMTSPVTYYLKETGTPDGYETDPTVYVCKITANGNGGYSVTYAASRNGEVPADSAFTSEFPQCVNVEKGTQQPEQPREIAVTFELQKVFEGFADLTGERQQEVIRNTGFALYSNPGCTVKVGDFVSNFANGTVTYQYTRNFTGLSESIQYFYIKETATDSAYEVSQQVYQVLVSCKDNIVTVKYALYKDADGKIVGSLYNKDGMSEKPTFNNTAVITEPEVPENPKPEEPTTPVDTEVSISLIKTFSDNFDGLSEADRNSVIAATTFGLYEDSACGTAVTGFAADGSGSWNASTKQVTYRFQMTATNLSADPVYYYLKETGTDESRYTVSQVIYAVKVWLPEGADKASVEYSVYQDEAGQKGVVSNLSYSGSFPQYNNVAKVTEPDNPDDQNDPNKPDNPDDQNDPKDPDDPNKPDDQNDPKNPDDQDNSEKTDTPSGNNTPSDNKTDTPSTPSGGDNTQNGNTPDTPSTPSGGDNTQNGNTPDTPDTPSGGDNTQNGNTPDTPSTPSGGDNTQDGNTPGTPDTPSGGDNTVSENTPGTPDTPNGGDNTVSGNTPGTPDTPSDSSNTVSNNTTDTPSGGDNTQNGSTPDTATGNSTTSTESGSVDQTASNAGNVTETSVLVSSAGAAAGRETSTLSSMTSAQTGESNVPFMALAGSLSAILAAGAVYVARKREQ